MARTTIAIPLTLAIAALGGCRDARQTARMHADYDQTGKLQLLTYDSKGTGKPDTWSYMDGAKVIRIEIDADGDGVVDRWEYYGADQKLEKVGTSTANDGRVDTWSYPPEGGIVRVERSTKRDGRVDQWESYSDGALTSVAFDTDGTGHPTRRLIYDAKGQLMKIEGAQSNPIK